MNNFRGARLKKNHCASHCCERTNCKRIKPCMEDGQYESILEMFVFLLAKNRSLRVAALSILYMCPISQKIFISILQKKVCTGST